MRSTSTPTSVQLSGFCATARIALPVKVRVRKRCRSTSVRTAIPKTASRFTESEIPIARTDSVEYGVRMVWSLPVKRR